MTDTYANDTSPAEHSDPRAMTLEGFDVEKYRHRTARFDLTEEQERAFILQLRDLMLAFVDLGFDWNPVQHVPSDKISCGQNAEKDDLRPITVSDLVKSIILEGEDFPAAFAAACERKTPTER